MTDIGPGVVPAGTVTLSEMGVADVTAALTAPKYTMSFAAVVLKFVPVIVTVVPIGPVVGVKKVITGGGTVVALAAKLLAPSNPVESTALTL